MKSVLSMLAALVLVFGALVSVRAEEDKKEVTLKGDICCAKCELKKEKACATVIKVKEGEKEVVYYFDAESGKKHHKEICQACKKGEVKGTVSEKGGKKTIKVSSVKFD